MGVYRINQCRYVFGWRKLGNPVAQIKHMTGVVQTVAVQHLSGFGGYPLG